jgi:hypothetical protein
MRKRLFAAAVWAAGVLAAVGGLATVGRTDPAPGSPGVGPTMREDSGAGELLVVVLGGVFADQAEAQAAADRMSFGDVQGYYVVPVAQFQGFREQLPARGDHALVSAFRTEQGANEFASFSTAMGYPAQVLERRVRSLGGLYAGLGQESAPDGSGPLTGPIPASLP